MSERIIFEDCGSYFFKDYCENPRKGKQNMSQKKLFSCGCGGHAALVQNKIHTEEWIVRCNLCGLNTGWYLNDYYPVDVWNEAFNPKKQKV